MLDRLLAKALLACAVLLAGCATRTPMAFENDTDSFDPGGKPVFLMTATFKNSYRTWFQPKAVVLHVERAGAKERKDRLNFVMDDKAKEEADTEIEGNTYLVRMALANGDYVIQGFTGFSGRFPIRGMFFAPLHADAVSAGHGVFYLGHIDATVRERQGNEFRAGPPLPLIDQAVAGFSGGTFDVTVSDHFDTDTITFRDKFPALRDVAIQKAVLPGFDRGKAQKWWEDH